MISAVEQATRVKQWKTMIIKGVSLALSTLTSQLSSILVDQKANAQSIQERIQ